MFTIHVSYFLLIPPSPKILSIFVNFWLTSHQVSVNVLNFFTELPETFNIVYIIDASTSSKSKEQMTKIVENATKHIKDHINTFKSPQNVQFRLVVYGKGVKTFGNSALPRQLEDIDINSLIGGATTSLQEALRDVESSFSDGSIPSNSPTLVVVFQVNQLTTGQSQRAAAIMDDLRSKNNLKTLWIAVDSGEKELGINPLIAPTDKVMSVSSEDTLYQVLPITSGVLSSFIGM